MFPLPVCEVVVGVGHVDETLDEVGTLDKAEEHLWKNGELGTWVVGVEEEDEEKEEKVEEQENEVEKEEREERRSWRKKRGKMRRIEHKEWHKK